MKRTQMFAAVATAMFALSPVYAIDIEVPTSDGVGQVGGFYGPYDPTIDAPPVSFPPTLPPDNDVTFQNYFMGRSTLGPLSTSVTTPERRAFFMFDLADVVIPPGDEITGVTIDLELTPGGSAVLANFSGGVEVVEFTSTPFTVAEILDPAGTSTPTDAIWSSFGSSDPYGAFFIDGDEAPSGSPPGANGTLTLAPDTYTIDLPGAIADVEAAVAGDRVFIVTGKLASFDPDIIGLPAPPAVDPYEYVFGLTDVATPSGALVPAPILTISTDIIPEPASLALLGLGACLLRRRR